MGTNVRVKDYLGDAYSCEDAIVLRNFIKEQLSRGVELDFGGYDRVSSSFLTCLFTELIEEQGREYIFNKINVKNLSNYTDYSRVVLGTTFQ